MNYGQKKTFILNFHLIYCINHLILPKNDEVHVAQKGQAPLRLKSAHIPLFVFDNNAITQ